MSKLLEIIDSLTFDENSSDVKQALIAEANALNKTNGDLYKRAKKAEGFEWNKETKQWTKKEAKPEPKVDTPEPNKLNTEPDYAKLAYLEGKKVSHADDQKLVLDEAKRLNLPLTDVLSMEHIQAKLKSSQAQREAMDGMPKDGGRQQGNTKGEVDYWLAKGETPDDQELAGKVIDARIKQEKTKNKFSNDLY